MAFVAGVLLEMSRILLNVLGEGNDLTIKSYFGARTQTKNTKHTHKKKHTRTGSCQR